MVKLWFGPLIKSSPLLVNRRRSLKVNAKRKKDGNFYPVRRSMPNNNTRVLLPAPWKTILCEHKRFSSRRPLFYVYNDVYFLTFQLPAATNFFFFNKSSNTLTLSQQFFSLFFNHFRFQFESQLRMLSVVFFSKMKFKGKGYYIYKNFRNTIAPQFGYYHRVYVYAYNISVKFLSKTSVLLFGFSKQDVLTVGYDFKSKKPINVFTGRGVRFARQVVYKKTGKVSSYR